MNTQNVNINKVYSGPLDLLIDLIIKDEIDIYDIPINTLTTKFIETMDSINFDNIYMYLDFSNMAATLLNIKSKTLLPKTDIDEDIEDPREELVNRILKYNYYKNISHILEDHYYSQLRPLEKRAEDATVLTTDEKIPYDRLDISGLSKCLSNMLAINQYNEKGKDLSINKNNITVEECIEQLKEDIENNDIFMMSSLFKENRSREYIVSYFLAILEVGKQQLINIIQRNGDIIIKKRNNDAVTN